MEKVKVKNTFHVASTGVTYKKGEEVEVPNELAHRHVKTGFMEIIKPEKIKLDKAKTT